MQKTLQGCEVPIRQNKDNNKTKEKRKAKPFKDSYIEVRVIKRGVGAGQMSTHVDSVRSKDNLYNRKGKLIKNLKNKETNVIVRQKRTKDEKGLSQELHNQYQ